MLLPMSPSIQNFFFNLFALLFLSCSFLSGEEVKNLLSYGFVLFLFFAFKKGNPFQLLLHLFARTVSHGQL